MDNIISVVIYLLLVVGGFFIGYWLRKKNIDGSNERAEI